MRNSPPIDRARGAIFRTAPTSAETHTQGGGGSSFTDEVLGSLVCVLSLQYRLRQRRIERAHGRLRILPDPQSTPPIIKEEPEEIQPLPLIEEPIAEAAVETVIVIEELPDVVELVGEVEEPIHADSAIEIGEVPHDLLFPPVPETKAEVVLPESGSTHRPRAVETVPLQERAIQFSVSRDVLGQYVGYILDRHARSLHHYIEAKAFERMTQAERRVQAAAKGQRWLPKAERIKRKRLRVLKLPAYLVQTRNELVREVQELVRSARWLTTAARDPENAFCMARAKNRRPVFFLVRLNEDGVGGKIIAVYDSPHFTHMVREHGRRGNRKLPLRRR